MKEIKKCDKKVFILLSADYGNVGDIAITIAQEEILKKLFPDRKIVEIPMTYAYEHVNEIKHLVNEDDIFTIIGGGNMGNMYLEFEDKRRFVIETFKDNKMVSFPQSIDFRDDDEGKKELKKSVDIYAQNDRLTIFAREKKSYDIMKSNFKNDVYLIPDIVFSLKGKIEQNTNILRNNVTLCLRDDRERVLDVNLNKLIRLLKKEKLGDIEIASTHIGEGHVKSEQRKKIFNNCLNKFRNSKVIITDRLHGMIFCAITDTPCIALDNSNNKVSSTYNTWLKDEPLIKFIEEYDEEKIIEYVKELSNIEKPKISLELEEKFEKLIASLDVSTAIV